MQPDWIFLALGVVLSAFIAAITASYVVGSKMATRSDVEKIRNGFAARAETDLRDTGESLAAIRQKIEQVELWIRDRYMEKDNFSSFQSDVAGRLNSEVAENRRRLEQLPAILVKVDTLWSFVMDRGRLEATDKGLMQRNSPLVLTEAGIKAIQPLMPAVAAYCSNHPELNEMGDDELASILVREFEGSLVREVCEPNHIYLGACIVLLMEALKMGSLVGRNGT